MISVSSETEKDQKTLVEYAKRRISSNEVESKMATHYWKPDD